MKKFSGWSIWIGILVLGGLGGCGGNEGFPGRYRAEIKGAGPPQAAILELNENGQGVWKISGDQLSFKWEVRGEEIRLHTREGGVLIGFREDKTIHLRLPGMPALTFTRLPR
jgi:hypothetical protein